MNKKGLKSVAEPPRRPCPSLMAPPLPPLQVNRDVPKVVVPPSVAGVVVVGPLLPPPPPPPPPIIRTLM
jgi:hypothetical protein